MFPKRSPKSHAEEQATLRTLRNSTLSWGLVGCIIPFREEVEAHPGYGYAKDEVGARARNVHQYANGSTA